MHQPNPWTSLHFQTDIRYARCLISAGGLCLVVSEPAKWMGKRDDYISEGFVEALKRRVPRFKKLPQRHQVNLAFYAWIEGPHRWSHWTLDGYMSIGNQR
jgi:hypothetical protein